MSLLISTIPLSDCNHFLHLTLLWMKLVSLLFHPQIAIERIITFLQYASSSQHTPIYLASWVILIIVLRSPVENRWSSLTLENYFGPFFKMIPISEVLVRPRCVASIVGRLQFWMDSAFCQNILYSSLSYLTASIA